MVEDKSRFVEDSARNDLERPIDCYPHRDGTNLKPDKSQDPGGGFGASVNEISMETVSPLKEDVSIDDSFRDTYVDSSSAVIDGRRSRKENSAETNETSSPKRDLPATVSSDYENISLRPKESMQHSNDLGTERSYDNDEKLTDSNVEDVESAESHFDLSRAIDDATSLAEVEKFNSGQDDPRRCENSSHSSLQIDAWKLTDDNCEEASIEDSCEAQLDFDHSKNVATLPNTSQTETIKNNLSNKPSTLIDDGRLVKIPLPTSSMNIIQSNAQFLNKSRNFLNFITEKSTNIMEKTLLPQNIAVRYNSLLKLSEGGGYASDRKHSEICPTKVDPSTDFSTIPDRESMAKSHVPSNQTIAIDVSNENFVESQNDAPENSENSPRIDENDLNGFSSNINSQTGIIDCDLPKENVSPPADNDVLNISYDRPEETAEFHSKSSADDEEVNRKAKRFVEDDSTEREISPEVLTDGLLNNPVYLTLVRDYARMREEKIKLADRVKHLENKNLMLEAQNSGELFTVQLETLEKTVEKLSSELRLANANQEELGRDYAAANRERESMVMKYAVSEKQLIDTQRARDYAERRFKEIAKDHELLQNKLRQAQSERTRICGILDTKCRELTEVQKEAERLKEDVNVRDVKLKWTQTKLKTEMETQKETQQKLDKAMARINDMKEECEHVRRESHDMIRKFQHSEENKAVTLDQQLKEQQARLILERHVTEDKEFLRIQLQKEVDLLKNRQQALIEENNTLSLKIQDLEKDRLAYESKLSELKILADQRQKEIVDLSAKVSHLETLKLQLIHKEQCLASNEAEVERLRQVNQELQADMDCCRQREAHMLDFTQKLTDKNVRLQSEFTAIEAKSAQLEQEQGPLREGIVVLKAKVKTLEEHLAHEKKKRTEECEILAQHLAEQTQLAQNLTQKFEDSQGEIAVLRRKQQISVKEMSRELQQCRKRLEAYENASPSNSLDTASRAGSNTSLNTGEPLNGTASDHSGEHTIQWAELDKQSLIELIPKLQKNNVKKAEKIDFLEEHTRTLVAELQKKTKIIQNYILHENFDAMGSNQRDRHKAELARYGGIMASVYNHRVSDDNMTLQLSLEINQKLQAVLEDTLLKNMTLKDNIDTLGEEIARLTMRNQQSLQQKSK